MLELQLEYIDPAHLAQTSPSQFKHYGKILKGQLREIELELLHVEDQFAAEFTLPPFAKLDPKGIMPILMADIADRKAAIRQLQQQLQSAADPPRLKAWLKQVVRRRQPDWDFDMPF